MATPDGQIVYFRYFRDDGKPFYYNCQTQETQWRWPRNGFVVDSETDEQIFYQPRKVRRSDPKPEPVPQSQPEPVPQPVAQESTPAPPKPKPRPAVPVMEVTEEIADLWRPPGFPECAKSNTIEEFAKNCFLKPPKGQSPADVISFQDKKIVQPLLKDLDKVRGKKAISMFQSILIYLGLAPASKKEKVTASVIIDYALKDSALINELYAQLMKQTTKSNEKVLTMLAPVWSAAACLLRPTDDVIPYVRSHICRLARGKIGKQMAFAFIRFEYLLVNGGAMFKDYSVDDLAKHYENSKFQYGVSLYEIMWNQKRRDIKLPVPELLVHTEQVLRDMGASETVGIFRLPGNMKVTDDLIVEANSSNEGYLDKGAIHDVGSFYKKWFREIPGGLIDQERTERLVGLKREEYIEFAESLPLLPKLILKHLIEFLRELSAYSATTKMDAANLAMVFCPNVICVSDSDPLAAGKYTGQSTKFLATLIAEWGVTPAAEEAPAEEAAEEE